MGTFFIDINDGPSVEIKAEPAVIRSDVIVSGEPVSEPLVVSQITPEIIIQEKIIEKPIEVIRDVIVEKIIEVPVEKIVTVFEVQKVEVPVEIIKEVIKEVEVPVEIDKLIFRDVVHKDVTSIVIFSLLAFVAGIIIGRV